MQRQIIVTEDGSTTIQITDWDECYHSKNGAIQEAYHVFIKNGLSTIEKKEIDVLEIGFGTGLNAFITFLEALSRDIKVNYIGVEAYPISVDEIKGMNYVDELKASKFQNIFTELHNCSWDIKNRIDKNFELTKVNKLFQDIAFKNQFDIIYFDAFGYQVQPELWSIEIFQKMYDALKPNSLLVTYAARGVIKRNMQAVGFKVVKTEGPPGKREMMIAFK